MKNRVSRQTVRLGPFEIDFVARELRKDTRTLAVPDRVFQILTLLLERGGEVVTREELRTKFGGNGSQIAFDRSLDTAINILRKVLGDPAEHPTYFQTIPGVGYRLIGKIDKLAAATPPKGTEQKRFPGGRVAAKVLAITLIAVAVALITYLFWPPPKTVRLAVLPFENLNDDPKLLYFSQGITEEVTTQLSLIDPAHVAVIASTSAALAGKDVSRVRRLLGVQYVVEGSVRRTGSNVRIAVRLVRTSDETHVWTHTYERELRQAVDIASEVASAVAGEIDLYLKVKELLRPSKAGTTNPEAWEQYLRGRYMWNRRDEESIRLSISYFQEAIRIDPRYAQAYAGLADSYSLLPSAEVGAASPSEMMPQAKRAAQKALELDEKLAEAHTSLGYVELVYEWNRQGAEQQMKRAIELNPDYGLGHQWYAHLLESSGRLDEALKELRLAQELDPLSPSVYAALAQTYYFKRDYDQAIASSNEALEKYPNFVLGYINLGRAYLGKKMYPEAIAALQKASELSHEGPGSTTALGYAYALAGKRPEAEEMLAHLRDLSRKRFVSSLYFAAIYNGLADKDKAFEYLERARQERSEYLVYLQQDPWSDSLQSDPRFEQVMRQVGF